MPAAIRRTLAGLIGLTIGMFFFAWALVPMYDLFCEITGLNGKVQQAAPELAVAARPPIDTSRTVSVRFVVEKGDGIPWEFEPMQTLLNIHPGEEKTVSFRVRNQSDSRLVARAVPSVVPGLAIRWLHKVECFCFQEQWLDAGEEARLGMRFYLDTDLPANYPEVVIAYTLYGLDATQDVDMQDVGAQADVHDVPADLTADLTAREI